MSKDNLTIFFWLFLCQIKTDLRYRLAFYPSIPHRRYFRRLSNEMGECHKCWPLIRNKSPKKFFSALRASVWSKISGGGSLDPPLFWDGLSICICLGEYKSEFPVTELIIQTKGRSSYILIWYWYRQSSSQLFSPRHATLSKRALRDKKKGRVWYWMILQKCKH